MSAPIAGRTGRLDRRYVIAIAVAVVAMLAALIGPTWVRYTGQREYLDVVPLDPRSLFRGNYVDLNYDVPKSMIPETLGFGDTVYVTFESGRPARPTVASAERPRVESGRFCLVGEYRNGVRFDNLEQMFAPQEQALELERSLSSMMAEISVTGDCRAILIGLVES